MKIEDATDAQIAHVALHMRDRDFLEFSAVNEADDRETLARAVLIRYGQSGALICASRDEEPVAIGALVMNRPNVGTLLFFATDAFPAIALGLTRWIRWELFPRYRDSGVHRIECLSIDGYEKTHRWIEMLGLKREAVLPGFGKSGETFHQFAWVKP